MEDRSLGMPRNVCLGLSYLLFPLAIVAFCVEKRTLSRDDKVHLWSSIVSAGVWVTLDLISTIFSWVPVLSWILWALSGVVCVVIYVFVIIAAVKCFRKLDDTASIPVVTDEVKKRIA